MIAFLAQIDIGRNITIRETDFICYNIELLRFERTETQSYDCDTQICLSVDTNWNPGSYKWKLDNDWLSLYKQLTNRNW